MMYELDFRSKYDTIRILFINPVCKVVVSSGCLPTSGHLHCWSRCRFQVLDLIHTDGGSHFDNKVV